MGDDGQGEKEKGGRCVEGEERTGRFGVSRGLLCARHRTGQGGRGELCVPCGDGAGDHLWQHFCETPAMGQLAREQRWCLVCISLGIHNSSNRSYSAPGFRRGRRRKATRPPHQPKSGDISAQVKRRRAQLRPEVCRWSSSPETLL